MPTISNEGFGLIFKRSFFRELNVSERSFKSVVMSAVFPGVVLTEGGHWEKVLKDDPKRAQDYLKERCPLGRFGEPSEIAPVVAFYCSQHASFSHGAIIPADAGQARSYMYHNYL